MKNITTPIASGNIRFTQNWLPAIDAGSYRVTFGQKITITGDDSAISNYGDSVLFAVSGDRFSLPDSEIDSVFPPSDAQGEFYNVLPHVTLTTRTLPWERTVHASGGASPGNWSAPSWLALLVYDEADSPPLVTPRTIEGLINPEAGILSYPDLTLEHGESVDDACNVVDLDGELFIKIAPSIDDLRWLAHVRTVSAAKKAGSTSPSEQRDYSLVVANRLPKMGSRTTVYLVSLENMAEFLPGSGEDGQPKTVAKTLRLACMANWTFECPIEIQTFAGVLESLSSVSVLAPASSTSSEVVSESQRAVKAAMAMGYVGLNHIFRDGGQTVSWYRGPFIPYTTTAWLRTIAPLRSADAAMQYDPDTGLLDASYACAWQLGRMLALQSKEFSGRLLEWKHAVKRKTLDNAELAFLMQRISPDVPTNEPPGEALEQIAKELIKKTIPALNRSGNGQTVPMRSSKGRPSLPNVLSNRANIKAAFDDVTMPVPLSTWLDRLRKLHGVPYPYLIPSEDLLPPESMRSFCLDYNWIDALVDGAFSLGESTDGDLAVRQAAHEVGLLHTSDGASPPVSGFILRSSAVKHWPGLEIGVYGAGLDLPLLRAERIGPETLICLVDGQLDRIELHEPPEGIHFGFDVPDNAQPFPGPQAYTKNLRNTSDGSPLNLPSVPIAGCLRADGSVINIDMLAKILKDALPPGSSLEYTTAEFALEMIEGVDKVCFVVGKSGLHTTMAT